jgi:hypothetical protein
MSLLACTAPKRLSMPVSSMAAALELWFTLGACLQ